MRGSCLCGAVAYEIDRLDGPIVHCFCRTCRKAQAAACASTARVDRAHFRWLRGREVLRSFESSPGKLRRFCDLCGCHVLAERPAQGWVILRVATLDDDPGSRPECAIWQSHRVPWLAFDAELPGFAEVAG